MAAVVQQPRPFGYVLGDTLTQRILLQSADRPFEPVALPPNGRAGLWFSRRSSRMDLQRDGRKWLVIEYQLINAPQALMTVSLPSLTFNAKTGGTVLTVPEWPVSIAPLTPRAAFAKGGLQELRPDHPAPQLPTDGLRLQLRIWSLACALALASWLAWWLVRSVRAAGSQPFAQALRQIRASPGDDSSDAWLALHRAFDRTAQLSLQLNTLSVLFERAPYLETERKAIERFYTESYERFFGTTHPSSRPAAQSAGCSPGVLCKILRQIEKRHER